MGIFSFLSPIGNLFKSGDKMSEFNKSFNQINTLLYPYLNKNAGISDKIFNQGQESIAGGTAGINNLIKYYSDFMSGNREDVLKNVDVSGVTKSYDQAAKDTAQFGVRGGRSSGTLAGLDFEKASQINQIVQNLRNIAPQQLQQLYATLLGLGTTQEGISVGINQGNLNAISGAINGALQKAEVDEQAKAQMIAAIFQAAGGAAGAALGCTTLDTPILVNNNIYIPAKEIDKDIMGITKDGEMFEAEVIDARITKSQPIFNVKFSNGDSVSCTKDHTFVIAINPYIEKPLKHISNGDWILSYKDNNYNYYQIVCVEQEKELKDVIIFKLNDNENNYCYVTNGLLSADDYIKN